MGRKVRQVSYSQGCARNKWECAPEWAWFWDGLVGLWVPALGPTGNTLWDVSQRRNPGVFAASPNAPTWSINQDAMALAFDGTDWIECGTTVPVPPAEGTVAVLYKPTVSVDYGMLLTRAAGSGTPWEVSTSLAYVLSDLPYFGRAGFLYIQANTIVPVGTRCMLVITMSSVATRLYQNGKLDATAAGNIWPDGNGIVYIGKRSDGYNINATISLEAYFSRALLPQEVAYWSADPLGPLRLPRRRLWPVGEGPIDYPVSFSVARVLSTVPAGMGAAVPALTLSRTQSISEEGIANAVGLLSSGIILALTESGLVQAGDNTILSIVRAITPVGVAGAVDGLTASTVRTVGTDGAAAVQDATALAQIRAFTTEGAVAAADQVVLAIIRAITTGVIVSASDGMTLGEVVTIATTSITAANPTLMVTRLLSVTSNGIAVVTGLAALSQTKSITADGMAIVGPGFGLPGYVSLITTFASTRAIVVLPTVIVPGALVDPERVYEVAVSLREYLLEEVQRSREVTKEERSEIVDIQVDVWW